MDNNIIKVTRVTEDLLDRAIVSDKIHLRPTLIVINSREAIAISRSRDSLDITINIEKLSKYRELDGYGELIDDVLDLLQVFDDTILLKEGLSVADKIVEGYELSGVKLSDNSIVYATDDKFFVVTEEERIKDIKDITDLEEVLEWLEEEGRGYES